MFRQSLGELIVAALDAITVLAIAEENVELGDPVESRDSVPMRADFALDRNANPFGDFRWKRFLFDEVGERDLLQLHQFGANWFAAGEFGNPWPDLRLECFQRR